METQPTGHNNKRRTRGARVRLSPLHPLSLSLSPHFPPLLPLHTENATGLIGPLKCQHDGYPLDCESLPSTPTATSLQHLIGPPSRPCFRLDGCILTSNNKRGSVLFASTLGAAKHSCIYNKQSRRQSSDNQVAHLTQVLSLWLCSITVAKCLADLLQKRQRLC